MMNSRQIRELLGRQGANIDPRLGKVIISLSDDMHAMKQQIQMLAALFDQMCTLLNTVGGATAALHQERVDRMKKQGIEVSTDPTLTGEGAEDVKLG